MSGCLSENQRLGEKTFLKNKKSKRQTQSEARGCVFLRTDTETLEAQPQSEKKETAIFASYHCAAA